MKIKTHDTEVTKTVRTLTLTFDTESQWDMDSFQLISNAINEILNRPNIQKVEDAIELVKVPSRYKDSMTLTGKTKRFFELLQTGPASDEDLAFELKVQPSSLRNMATKVRLAGHTVIRDRKATTYALE